MNDFLRDFGEFFEGAIDKIKVLPPVWRGRQS
jgi:hypothetical protein